MTVASLELCIKLFELSGWADTYLATNIYNSKLVKRYTKHSRDHVPAYDLGYLLRKLPRVDPKGYYSWFTISSIAGNKWQAFWESESGSFSEVVTQADNPEDAACSLALTLFLTGVLSAQGEVHDQLAWTGEDLWINKYRQG